MTETRYRAKAGTAQWSIHLWLDNGHDTYSRRRTLEPVPKLEEAQETAGAELRRLEAAVSFAAGTRAYWWADLQHGTWHPIEHDHDAEVIYDATWVASGRQYTGRCTEDRDVGWEQL